MAAKRGKNNLNSCFYWLNEYGHFAATLFLRDN